MLVTRIVAWMVSIGLMVLGAGVVSSQDYPNKPIRIVTSSVGSSVDFPTRLIAQGLIGALGQQVIVENRSSSVIPGEIVAKATPDGYTLLSAGTSLWVGPLLRYDTPYDPVKDFAPISLTNRAPSVLVVHPSLPINSVQDLIAYAKAKPGALNYSSGGTGSTGQLAAELFKAMAGVNIVRIPYASGSAEFSDLLGGRVQLTFGGAASVAPHIKSGKLRALGVASAQPSTLFPGLRTIAASGLPGYEAGQIQGMFAPAKTSARIINRMNKEVVRILNLQETKEKFLNNGIEAVGSSPEEFAAAGKSAIVWTAKVIKDAGIRPE